MEMDQPLMKRLKLDFDEEPIIGHINKGELKCDMIKKSLDDEEINKMSTTKLSNNCVLSLSKNLHNNNRIDLSNPYLDDVFENKIFSPKKRLQCTTSNQIKNKLVFRYGNYSRYYGYRNMENIQDGRLNIFSKYKTLFEGKEILDIGCNSGLITMKIAEDSESFSIKYITGLDIDKNLINKATKIIEKKQRNIKSRIVDKSIFPFNIKFIHGNYVLRDDILLEIEREQFDLILCLSVTKWIHLNFGDNGLKQAFRRMFRQIRPGGCLILEPQPWGSYKRRKNLTSEININYKSINFFPEMFVDYLLGPEVKFSELKIIDNIEHPIRGFRRPLQIFYKK